MLWHHKMLLLITLAALVLAGCRRDGQQDQAKAVLQISLTHEAGGQPLQAGVTYTNTLGETFVVSRFKYYISNVALLNGNAVTTLPPAYYLVDNATDSTKTVRAEIPRGTYTGIRFLLGVDSARNVSGAQTGALDPLLDMFWTWSTGYIMAKLEGSAPLSTAPNNRIQYHIGGFSGPYSSLRTVQFNFPAPVRAENTLQVALAAELMRWFDAVHRLPIAQQAVSMTPGALSAQYADNYARMFRLQSVQVP